MQMFFFFFSSFFVYLFIYFIHFDPIQRGTMQHNTYREGDYIEAYI